MALPYRWHPSGTRHKQPEVGDLWPHEHAVYRVIEINPVAEVDWTDKDRRALEHIKPAYLADRIPRMVVVRPVSATTGDVRDRDHDLHFRYGGSLYWGFEAYPDDHYPICATCHEPMPCREQMAERISVRASERMARYEMAGVCPACGEVVTRRQASRTFRENIEIIGGPPVTFHLRAKCSWSARQYAERWAKEYPNAPTQPMLGDPS